MIVAKIVMNDRKLAKKLKPESLVKIPIGAQAALTFEIAFYRACMISGLNLINRGKIAAVDAFECPECTLKARCKKPSCGRN
ncbi:MAG: hypothetical protein IAI50_16215 [Candidatus Eremiobacteraeota bacterium]|nr:hypothetical protein [Candidatus Eremiobacteraeota bacterium]